MSSIDRNDYGTPAYILDAARTVQGGHFDLDPFSSAWHNTRVRAKRWMGPTHSDPRMRDGFDGGWLGFGPRDVWCNPPYSADILGRAVHRWADAIESDETLNAWLLVPATPATKWAQHALQWPHCLLAARVKHHHPSLPPDHVLSGTRNDSMVIYAGPRYPAFRRVFGELGVCR